MTRCYFNDIREQIIGLLENAHDSVDIAMAWFTNERLLQSLIDCLSKNVKVRLILMDDFINHAEFGVDFNQFIANGGILYLYPQDTRMMHNKFCVIDGQTTLTGSYNWTNYAETRNCENIMVSDEKDIADQYLGYFSFLLTSSNYCEDFKKIELGEIDFETFSSHYHDIVEEIRSVSDSAQREKLSEQIDQKAKAFPPSSTPSQSNWDRRAEETPKIDTVQGHQDPVSRYHIGFKAYLKETGSIGLRTLISKGAKLPCTVSRDAWTNIDNTSEIECEFFYGETENLDSCHSFSKLQLTNLPQLKSGEVKFKTNITFDTNGYIRIEFVCVNTGEGKDATCFNSGFVEYN